MHKAVCSSGIPCAWLPHSHTLVFLSPLWTVVFQTLSFRAPHISGCQGLPASWCKRLLTVPKVPLLKWVIEAHLRLPRIKQIVLNSSFSKSQATSFFSFFFSSLFYSTLYWSYWHLFACIPAEPSLAYCAHRIWISKWASPKTIIFPPTFSLQKQLSWHKEHRLG